MSERLRTELRTYMSFLDAESDPIAIEDIATPPQPLEDRKRRANGMAIVAGAAIATFILVGAVAWLVPLDGGSSPADEPRTTIPIDQPVTTTVNQVTTPPLGALTVSWVSTQWGVGSGPSVRTVVGTSTWLSGTDRSGHLWRSVDGVQWERTLPELDSVAVVSSPSGALASGLADGRNVLLVSTNGEEWTQVDRSAVPNNAGSHVLVTTPSGLTWFGPNAGVLSGEGVLAVIDGDRITDVHDPPWDECCFPTDLVEVGGNIAAYQHNRNESPFSSAWEYLGNGEWSAATDVTVSGEHPVVGDTVLRIDHTGSTCCGIPTPGESLWPLLSSSDGIQWTEITQIRAEDVHSVHVKAGSSFWIYGPGIYGEGGEIDVAPDSPIRYSTDGLIWHNLPLPTADDSLESVAFGTVHIAGNTIFIARETNASPYQYWVATVETK